MEKRCSRCNEVKAIDEFPAGNGAAGVYNYCRSCSAVYQREAKVLRAEGRKRCWLCGHVYPQASFAPRSRYCDTCEGRRVGAQSLRNLFGLTLAEYDALFEAQGGRCYLCRRPPKKGKRLAVDHDHITGLVRGLLCPESQSCNHMLGLLREDVAWLAAAVEYLTSPPAVKVLGERYVPRSLGAAGMADKALPRRSIVCAVPD